jgi:hypothetical protein
MRAILSGIAAVNLLLTPSAIAGDETCSGRAQACVNRWGGPRTACYDSFRLAACEKTGKYVAPNGNVWPAARSQTSK